MILRLLSLHVPKLGRLFAIPAIATSLALTPGCAPDEDVEMSVAEVDAALCAAETTDTLLAVKPDAKVRLLATASKDAAGPSLPPGTVVVRRDVTEASPNAPLSRIVVKTGPLAGQRGFVPSESLALRAPTGGSCANGVDFERNASPFERGQSLLASPLASTMIESTLQCVVGLDNGVDGGAAAFVEGFAALASTAFELAREGLERERLKLLYSFGNADAYERLQANDDARARKILGGVSAIAHAIPVLHRLLASEWVYYQTLDGPHQARYVCELVGRLTFEVVVFIATGSMGQVGKVGSIAGPMSGAGKLATVNADIARTASIPGRLGYTPMVVLPEAFVKTQRAEYWLRVQEGLDALRRPQSLATKQRLIREISDDMNVPSIADRAEPPVVMDRPVGRGNCGNAAWATMFSLANGRPTCTLPYLDDQIALWPRWKGAFDDYGVTTRELPFGDFESLERVLVAELAEGQMAWFGGKANTSGHATIAIKLEGRLYNVNNQGVDVKIGVPEGTLQPLEEYVAAYRQRKPEVTFTAIVTDLVLGRGSL